MCVPLNVTDHVSYPDKTTGRILHVGRY